MHISSVIFSVLSIIVVWACTCVFLFKVFGEPETDIDHKFWGFRVKPVVVTDKLSGRAHYAVRVYTLWGLEPTKWYLRDSSKYRNWRLSKLDGPGIFYKSTKDVEDLMNRIEPFDKHMNVETRTVEELEMEEQLEDIG